MESYMVDNKILDPKDCINLVVNYFNTKLTIYQLIKSGHYTGYWWVEYKNERENILIYFDGDIGYHFAVYIDICGTRYSLWQYDKSVNDVTISTEENILFQLNILKQLLDGL